MKKNTCQSWLQFAAAVVAASVAMAVDARPIDFEAVSDGVGVGAAFPGIVFANATVARAGVSLNDLEFPPRSGEAVAFDDGGPMVVQFRAPVDLLSGYFTYSAKMSLTAYDEFGGVVGQGNSLFENNLALSGQAGAAANEFVQVAGAGIRSVVLRGDPAGGSFVVDDLFFRPASVSASGLYTFRDNNFGLVAGPARDIIVIGAWDPVPGAQAGTTGTATQIDSLTGSLVIVPLLERGYTANPAALENITPYSPGLTGAWTYDLQNGGDSTQLTGPVLGNVVSMPFATNVAVTGTGPTPTVSWNLPSTMPAGVEVDFVQVFVWERDATKPGGFDLLHLGPWLSPTQTRYEIPLNLIAEPGRAAVPSLSMEAGRNYTIAVALIDGNALNFQLTRSIYGVDYAPVPVPEPSRLVMLAAGLGVVVAAGRHVRRSGVRTHRAS